MQFSREKEKILFYYNLEKPHSKFCEELVEINKIIRTNIIGNYNDYINKCFNYLDSTENYNKAEFKIALQSIYNENNIVIMLYLPAIKNFLYLVNILYGLLVK